MSDQIVTEVRDVQLESPLVTSALSLALVSAPKSEAWHRSLRLVLSQQALLRAARKQGRIDTFTISQDDTTQVTLTLSLKPVKNGFDIATYSEGARGQVLRYMHMPVGMINSSHIIGIQASLTTYVAKKLPSGYVREKGVLSFLVFYEETSDRIYICRRPRGEDYTIQPTLESTGDGFSLAFNLTDAQQKVGLSRQVLAEAVGERLREFIANAGSDAPQVEERNDWINGELSVYGAVESYLDSVHQREFQAGKRKSGIRRNAGQKRLVFGTQVMTLATAQANYIADSSGNLLKPVPTGNALPESTDDIDF